MTIPTNKNLEDLFNLPDAEVVFEDDIPVPPPAVITKDTLSNLERINEALPTVRGLEADDAEMDELANLAKGSYKDLVDLGMQVDSRSAGDILSVAQQFLGHAITAKTAKMNKKLKMIDLQLKKAKLDESNGGDDETPTAKGQVLDRNELLAEILAQQKLNQSNK